VFLHAGSQAAQRPESQEDLDISLSTSIIIIRKSII